MLSRDHLKTLLLEIIKEADIAPDEAPGYSAVVCSDCPSRGLKMTCVYDTDDGCEYWSAIHKAAVELEGSL